jgi:hypothetical protein
VGLTRPSGKAVHLGQGPQRRSVRICGLFFSCLRLLLSTRTGAPAAAFAAAGYLLLPRPHPKPPPALVRAYQEPRSPLTLNLPYYAARKGEGFALIPWDRYMEEAEDLLQGLGEEGP